VTGFQISAFQPDFLSHNKGVEVSLTLLPERVFQEHLLHIPDGRECCGASYQKSIAATGRIRDV
jgi:hypothetical protein